MCDYLPTLCVDLDVELRDMPMKKYIALLRGVNVGGKNTVSMPLLKSAFEKAGFLNVSTYINIGNVLFSTNKTDIEALQRQCANIILKTFKLDIPVSVISAADLADALNHAPEWWDNDENSKHNAIFVISPATSEAVIKETGETKPEFEQVDYYGQVVFWSAPVKKFSKTRWSKFVSSKSYVNITIRNANTAKKLARLSEQQ